MYGLSDEIFQALSGLGYADLTEVQNLVIPAVLANRDLIVSSPTGSGKTAAFAIPVSEQVVLALRQPQALVLVPTRELALQVKQSISYIGRFKKIRCAAIFGGQSMAQQRNELRQRVHVVVGTPGRTFDHLEKNQLDLSKIRYLIIDEADKMLELNFVEQVSAIIERLPNERTTLVFSATMPEPIQQLCTRYMKDPQRIDVAATTPIYEKIRQTHCAVSENQKTALLLRLLHELRPERCIVFCNTREQVEDLVRIFQQTDFLRGGLHGGMKQQERLETMQGFKQGLFRILIATDVAARGIHVDDVSLIVNFDMPMEKESYIHRIGRTGRQEKSGVAVSFITPPQQNELTALEEYLHYKIPRQEPMEEKVVEQGKLLISQKPSLKNVGNSATLLNQSITRIRINAGRKQKFRPGDIVGAIVTIPGMTASDIGIIDIQETCSYVEIFNNKGDWLLEPLSNANIKGRIRTLRQIAFHEF